MRRLSVALDNALQEIDLGRRQRLGVIFGRAKQPMLPELPLVAKLVGPEAQALIRRCAGLAIENQHPIARLDSFGLIDKRAALFTAFGGLFPLLRLLGRSRDIGAQLNQELVDRVGDCFVGDPGRPLSQSYSFKSSMRLSAISMRRPLARRINAGHIFWDVYAFVQIAARPGRRGNPSLPDLAEARRRGIRGYRPDRAQAAPFARAGCSGSGPSGGCSSIWRRVSSRCMLTGTGIVAAPYFSRAM